LNLVHVATCLVFQTSTSRELVSNHSVVSQLVPEALCVHCANSCQQDVWHLSCATWIHPTPPQWCPRAVAMSGTASVATNFYSDNLSVDQLFGLRTLQSCCGHRCGSCFNQHPSNGYCMLASSYHLDAGNYCVCYLRYLEDIDNMSRQRATTGALPGSHFPKGPTLGNCCQLNSVYNLVHPSSTGA
jgi:hypothetical protein